MRQEACSTLGVPEFGSFAQGCEAKAACLEGRRGGYSRCRSFSRDTATRHRPQWRIVMVYVLCSSLLWHQQQAPTARPVNPDNFRVVAIHSFDDRLEQLGVGPRFERW